MKKIIILFAIFSLLTGCCAKTNYDKGFSFNYSNQSNNSYNTSSWSTTSNNGVLNPNSSYSSQKKTTILGNNKDVVTIMLYMCGSDLESQAMMGSYDLQEMANAKLASNVNLIVYTGGTTKLHIDGISTRYNQIYKVLGSGQIKCLVDNAGSAAMTNPDTLVDFIDYCSINFPANRYELIMWDHGAGTVSGYGYDEKYPNSGSMSLAQIDQALTEANVQFDFVGFDACLMANLETAIMLSEHADYLIASEESEPGIGWYYTDWLNTLSSNTSIDTVNLGKVIADSFVSTCAKDTPKQPATLSVIDLNELSETVFDSLSDFSISTTDLINNNQYKTVVNARVNTREFATSSKLDLVDLVDFAYKLDTTEAKELSNDILKCIKYNKVSNTMNNSYGLSIYFPYRSTRYINTVLNTYDSINMNSDYSDCIRAFASYQSAGQVASGGSHSPSQSFDGYDTSQYDSQGSAELIYSLINSFINSDSTQQSDPYSALFSYGISYLLNSMFDRSISQYLFENHFDVDLNWTNDKIKVSEKQWSMIESIQLNVFIDDGMGYIDLGSDNYFETDKSGNLLKIDEMTWLACSIDNENWQVVPFYYQDSTIDNDNFITTGTIPVLLNGISANLLVYIDDYGIEIVGATFDNDSGLVSKSVVSLNKGDVIEFVCDYYNYDGTFQDNYILNDPITIVDQLYLADVYINNQDYVASYQIKDIYQQTYWSENMKKSSRDN